MSSLGIFDLGPVSTWLDLHKKDHPYIDYTFADTNARWLWSHEDAATYGGKSTDPDWETNPLLNKPFEFHTTVDVQTETKAILHLIVDNFARVELNGETMQCPPSSNTWCGDSLFRDGYQLKENYPKIPMTLRPGLNELRVIAWNMEGPGGFVASLIAEDGTVLRNTNTNDWKFDPNPGVKPYPQPHIPPPSPGSSGPFSSPSQTSMSNNLFGGMSTNKMLIIAAVVVVLSSLMVFGLIIVMR